MILCPFPAPGQYTSLCAPEAAPLLTSECVRCSAATRSSAGGLATAGTAPMMPPQLEHGWLAVDRRHRVDALRRVIHSLNAQRALVFMNFQHRLKVRDILCLVAYSVGNNMLQPV